MTLFITYSNFSSLLLLPSACPDIPLSTIPSNTPYLPSLNLDDQAARAYKTVSWTNTSQLCTLTFTTCLPLTLPISGLFFRFSLHVATYVKSLEGTSVHLNTKRRRKKKTYTDDPMEGLDRSATVRGRDNDIRFSEHLLTCSHEQTSQFIIHDQFFLNSLNHAK
jgi:hypothetical protein